jgi:starch phosphorylase
MGMTMDPPPGAADLAAVPAPLQRLRGLAYNLRWAWNHDAVELFRRLDPALWEATEHNPVLLLRRIERARLAAAAADGAFLADLARVAADFDAYLQPGGETWFATTGGRQDGPLVAYFSMEFGLTECLPIFSGGLGVLAGDHLKSASDLGVPLIGVSLFYRGGYFRQSLDAAGRQQDAAEENEPADLPLTPATRADGAPLIVEVPFPGRQVAARVWLARVGRVALYLLDTDLPANAPDDRRITARLYGGDVELRIQQELVLGLGGYRALQELGLDPPVYHMNEGHAAFLALAHARRLMEAGKRSFAEARTAATPGLVFTTHTPVPAGHDYFPPELMERYFADYARALGLTMAELLALGRKKPDDYREYFCMTVLALRLAAHSNGVSALHGEVSRRMWRELWPGAAEDAVPIGQITNGVHLPSFLAPDLARLYAQALAPDRPDGLAGRAVWRRVERVPDAELWSAHERLRERLLTVARGRPGADSLDPAALTVGFARRFATYKRAALLLRDPARLARLLGDPARPVQFLFAGKAHPRDEAGKELIGRLATLAGEARFRGRIVFLADYDVALARALTQGADVWLNNPQRPYEASGTSGMKAAANGVLNVSTLDGWWAEAWEEAEREGAAIGWAIGRGEQFDDAERQADLDAEALYATLEGEVLPAFYERDAGGIPRRWTARMKGAIGFLAPQFNTDRMVREYAERFYLPAAAAVAGARQGGGIRPGARQERPL